MAIADLTFVVLFLIGCAVTGWYVGPMLWKPKPKLKPMMKWPRKRN